MKVSAQEQCAYVEAVLAQQPSYCYAVSNMTLREKCMADSNNPDAIAGASAPQSQEQAFVPDVSMPPGGNSASGLQGPLVRGAVELCMEKEKTTRDSCTRAVAIETGNLSMCNSVLSGDIRPMCVANIAARQKKLADCGVLERISDKELCRQYSSGAS